MPEYDGAHFEPPAPVVQTALRCLTSGAMIRGVELLLDSGADVTLLPQSAVAQLGVTADSDKRYELMGFDGNRSFAQAVRLDMLISGKVFRGLYLLTEDVRGVAGRDVLNHFVVTLDGPSLRWEMVDERRP